METLVKIGKCIGSIVHWLTGWIVHPGRGGCCEAEAVKDQIKENIENFKK